MIRQLTVISVFFSNKWQACNQVFLTGRCDPTRKRDKTRPEAQVSRVKGGGGEGGTTLPETAFQEI